MRLDRPATRGRDGRSPGTVAAPSVLALRSLATPLLAVLMAGGVVLPAVHEVVHASETASARSEHVSAFHTPATDSVADAPCPPPPPDVDCAVCSGLSPATDLAPRAASPLADVSNVAAAEADRVHRLTASGAGARAPPAA